jgi:hypothetical protein
MICKCCRHMMSTVAQLCCCSEATASAFSHTTYNSTAATQQKRFLSMCRLHAKDEVRCATQQCCMLQPCGWHLMHSTGVRGSGDPAPCRVYRETRVVPGVAVAFRFLAYHASSFDTTVLTSVTCCCLTVCVQAATNASYPIGRIATATEIAEAAVWVATRATFMTGHTLVLDGGSMCS